MNIATPKHLHLGARTYSSVRVLLCLCKYSTTDSYKTTIAILMHKKATPMLLTLHLLRSLHATRPWRLRSNQLTVPYYLPFANGG
jgi:hypothetical protein